jgi:hypothetical protein
MANRGDTDNIVDTLRRQLFEASAKVSASLPLDMFHAPGVTYMCACVKIRRQPRNVFPSI